MNETPVYRKILKTPTEFREFLHSIERPKFAITDSDGESEFLQQDEWIFSNDSDLLMQSLLEWKTRGCKLVYQEPDHEFDGEWTVIGLPDYFNDAAAMVRVTPVNGNSEGDDARKAFFDQIRENDYSYGFFSLKPESYDRYLKDWESDYDKQIDPEKYRAKKYSALIADCYGSKKDNEPMSYYIQLTTGEAGRVIEAQLKALKISPKQLIGMKCVVNGLEEVEQIGDVSIPRMNH